MSIRSIFLSKPGVFLLATWLAGSLVWGANSRYVALFSAERESYRRLLIDGVGDRRVDVELDSLGRAVVKVRGVGEQTYIGRRAYERGYLVPVSIRVDFPRNNLMSIQVSGTRFRDFVRYRVMDSDIYIIDLYTQALPRESYFREETISALWPNGRFQPDITPATPLPAAEPQMLIVPRTLVRGMAPYRKVVLRAVVWAGGVFGLLLVIGLPLVWLIQRRKTAAAESGTPLPTRPAAAAVQPTISDARVKAIMALNRSLSYDEASLIAAVGGEKSLAGSRRS